MRRRVLAAARALGLFALTNRLTARGLRILCYHGVALADEHRFQPKLFISEAVFRQRVTYLRARGYQVLGLGEAIDRLDARTLPPRAVVITFDDGWLGTGSRAAPVLSEAGFPSTLYVTTRDVEDGVPVLNVAIRYLLWSGRGIGRIDADAFGVEGHFDLADPMQRERLAQAICERGQALAPGLRLDLLQSVAIRLQVDWDRVVQLRLCLLMDKHHLAQLPALGMDLQLHTHSHHFPAADRPRAMAELQRNREALSAVANTDLVHFCYPSGEFNAGQFAWLRAAGMRSATTCLSGFNYPDTDRMALRRFLDGENISQVEFEAEMSGFLEMLRRVRSLLGRAAQA